MGTLVIQELRERAIEMMVEVTRILERHHVRFWIEYGTMLGAVRDGRMIPWDNEVDIGVFEDDFKNRQEVLDDLKASGYEFRFKPDRIKIFKAGWRVGSFNFDVHLYHKDKESVYVSAGIPRHSIFGMLFSRLDWVVSLYDRSEEITYHFDNMMKLLATRFDLYDEKSVPKVITFKKGPYANELSYELSGEGFCLMSSPIDNNSRRFTRFAVKLMGKVPPPVDTSSQEVSCPDKPGAEVFVFAAKDTGPFLHGSFEDQTVWSLLLRSPGKRAVPSSDLWLFLADTRQEVETKGHEGPPIGSGRDSGGL